jgi:hypothetical protein
MQQGSVFVFPLTAAAAVVSILYFPCLDLLIPSAFRHIFLDPIQTATQQLIYVYKFESSWRH